MLMNTLKLDFFVRRFFHSSVLAKFATVDPVSLSGKQPHEIQNLVAGTWKSTGSMYDVVDPLNGDVFIKSANTKTTELKPFIDSMANVPKSGLHNPFKNPERYVLYGSVLQKAAELLHHPDVYDFFAKCIQRTMPKSYKQAAGEISVIRRFCENFSGDNVRFLMRGSSVAGDHLGQQSHSFRWPYGPVAIVSPFNFPLEIPVMQFLSASMVGNKPVVKTESTQGMPVEQFLRFLHFCGLPPSDVDFINARGPVVSELLQQGNFRLVQFTGSSSVADEITRIMKGRVRIEDAGFDWKILGATVSDVDYVAWQCDQDAYSISGQKCSAQSILFAHRNWVAAGLLEKIASIAATRNLADLSIGPVLSHTTEEIAAHVQNLCALEGSKLLFGGNPLKGHNIPSKYGAFEPTAVFVPLDTILASPSNYTLVTTELFGPVQVVTEWKDGEEGKISLIIEKMGHHLTAGIVSSDINFQERIIGSTVNGTTYSGIRAKTTGAPANHWFGPGGDPCAAGIGTREAVLSTWTFHREIIFDNGPVPADWRMPPAT